jgi:hypothetical protein
MGWLSSLFLLVATAGSVMVYALRRHRLDDYRGRYRVWRWAALACLIASIDATTGLHRAVSWALQDLAQTPLYGDGSIWWLLVFSAVFGIGIVRMLIEVRGSFAAALSLLIASAAYVSGALIGLHLLLPGWGLLAELIQTSCVMVGHLHVALAVAAYSRYVHRGAQRELPRESEADTPESSEEEPPARPAPARSRSRRSGGSVRVDAAHETAAKKPRTDLDTITDIDFEPVTNEDVATDDSTRLSKSERRRLRKENRRKRRAA